MNNASVRDNRMRSPLMEAAILRPRQKRSRRKIAAHLILTSLVDAFSIMLLYLLCTGSGNGSTLELDKTKMLPVAIKSEAIHTGTLVRVEAGRYFIASGKSEIQVGQEQLSQKLQQIKATLVGKPEAEASAIIIQADRDVDFAMLAPVVRAGSIVGFNQFKFAVLSEEGGK